LITNAARANFIWSNQSPTESLTPLSSAKLPTFEQSSLVRNRFLRRAQRAFVASTIEGFIDFDRVR
jgi:hypothetical protein